MLHWHTPKRSVHGREVNVGKDALPGESLPPVLVTREEPRPVVEAVEQSGGRAVVLTLLRTRWLSFHLPEDMTLDSYDIVAFTSARALQALDRVTDERQWTWPPSSAAAAVGDRTAHELQALGWLPESVAPGASSRSLASTLVRRGVRGKRILFPCSALADAVLPDACRRAGAQVDVVPVYTTEASWTGQPALKMELQRLLKENLEQGCVITCASPSAVKVLSQLAEPADMQALLRQAPLVAIGPTTERAAHKRSLQAIVSVERSLASMARKAVDVARTLRP
jgi:uroporphyrinogen III methyltransferase/synthase